MKIKKSNVMLNIYLHIDGYVTKDSVNNYICSNINNIRYCFVVFNDEFYEFGTKRFFASNIKEFLFFLSIKTFEYSLYF